MIKEHVNRIPVHMDGKTIYDIVLEDSFDSLAKEISVLGTEKKKICIIADSNVADIYLDEVTRILFGCCREVTSYVFPAGEENKNLKTVQGAYEHLILNHYDRKDLLVALGGGVTGDLCGFVAATYLRGVDFVQIPTTLLSQVDSGIGGKTGVDFDSYKNMVGAFHMPKLVYTNVSVLRTLPDNQFSGGMGFLILIGTVVNNGILYVDTVNQYRMTMDLRTALVEAGATRLRPILMTSSTTILSMIPMVLSTGSSASTTKGLAIVNIGGLTAGILVALFILPVYYAIMNGKKERKVLDI